MLLRAFPVPNYHIVYTAEVLEDIDDVCLNINCFHSSFLPLEWAVAIVQPVRVHPPLFFICYCFSCLHPLFIFHFPFTFIYHQSMFPPPQWSWPSSVLCEWGRLPFPLTYCLPPSSSCVLFMSLTPYAVEGFPTSVGSAFFRTLNSVAGHAYFPTN